MSQNGLLARSEREVRSEGYRVPAMTQCRGESNRSDSWHQTGEQIRSEEAWLITYQDCEAWSEGQNRKRAIERDYAAIRETGFPEMFLKAWKELWSSPVLTTTRKRICTSAPWDHSLMQGIRGCGDSVEHAVILAEFKDLVSKRLGPDFGQIFKGQTNIDDVYSELLARIPWQASTVAKVWAILKEHYANHGYALDSSKSGLSAHKVTYLGLSSVFGLDLPSGLKTLAKSGFVHPFAAPTIEEYVERLKGYLRSSYSNLLPVIPVYSMFTALECLRICRDTSFLDLNEEKIATRSLAVGVQLKASSDLGGFGWPGIVQVNLQDSCGTSETSVSSLYASLFTPGLSAELYKMSIKAYFCICKYALSLKMTKRSGFEALRNSYSVRPKIPPSGKIEIEKFARDKATEDEDAHGRDLNCGSLLGKQHSQNFEEGLEVLLSRMQLDAGTGRALANAMPESARLAMTDKYVSGLAASGQRTPQFRRIMELMRKSDLNRLNFVRNAIEKVIVIENQEGDHLLSAISPMKPTEVSARLFANQAVADGISFQNQTLGHPFAIVLNTTLLSVEHHIEIKSTIGEALDILSEGYPGLFGSKRSSRRVESSSMGSAAVFSSLFHVEPFGKDVVSAFVSIADERSHGFCDDLLLMILWLSWGGNLKMEPFDRIPEISSSSSKRAIGSCAVTSHETLSLRNIWHLFETRAPKGTFLLEKTPNLMDPAALRFYLKGSCGLTSIAKWWLIDSLTPVEAKFSLNMDSVVPERSPIISLAVDEAFDILEKMVNNSVVSDLCAMVQDSVDRLNDDAFLSEIELRCGRKASSIASSTKRRIRPTVMQISMLDQEGLVFMSQGIRRTSMAKNCATKESLHKKFLAWACDIQTKCQEVEVIGAFLDSGFLMSCEVKCYNLIPRYPLSLFMSKLGWPLYLIRTYMSALIGLRRSFLVLNTVSEWQQSFTGVPEGCALAVAAMLTLSAALYHHLRVKSPDTTLFTFADNWALKFLRAAHTPMGIFALEEFCRSLRLRISVPKSWLWTLNNKTEKLVEGLQLQGTLIPVVKHVKDLGLDTTYRGRNKKDFQKKRLRLGLQRCARVNKQLHPTKKASRLILASCFPKAAYGVEIQMPTKKEFCSFRTSVARSLGLARKGASPWISLNLLDKNHDFEFYAQIRTIMFWRQYVKLFPARRNNVFEKLLSPKSRGPVTTLAHLIQTWGQILPDGKFYSDFLGLISWVDCS